MGLFTYVANDKIDAVLARAGRNGGHRDIETTMFGRVIATPGEWSPPGFIRMPSTKGPPSTRMTAQNIRDWFEDTGQESVEPVALLSPRRRGSQSGTRVGTYSDGHSTRTPLNDRADCPGCAAQSQSPVRCDAPAANGEALLMVDSAGQSGLSRLSEPRGSSAREPDWVDHQYYSAPSNMTREDFEFLDFCFLLLNVADALGIFRTYFEDQGEEFVDDMLSGGGGGDEYGNVGVLTGSSWHVHYFHYLGAFNGEHKTQIELLSDMHTILGDSVFGMGWRGKIQLHLEWFRCSRDFFLDTSNTPAERICCALDAAATIAHEMVHYCQDWREAPAFSLEGFLRVNMADQLQHNEVVQLFVLMALHATYWPTDWTVNGCAQTSTNWTCGSHWTTRNNTPCSASGLQAAVDTFTACSPTRQP